MRVSPLCCVDLAALRVQADERRDVLEARPPGCRFVAQGKRFIVATEGLKDCRPLAIDRFDIEREPLGTIEVGQSIVESMEDGSRSRAGDPSRCVGGRIAHELFRDFLCPVVVGDVAEDQPTQRDQLDETGSSLNRGVRKPDLELQGVDLSVEIQQGNRAVGERPVGHHDAAASGRFGGAM